MVSRPSTARKTSSVLHRDVTCPFCGLLCDDLSVRVRGDRLSVSKNGCARAKAGYERALSNAVEPLLAGHPASLEHAAAAAAGILARARQPLICGLGTDVDGVRAALRLAERCGAVVDHMHGDALHANIRVLQSGGWYATTLSEVRNRADVVVLAGADIVSNYANFARRCLEPATAFGSAPRHRRRVIYLGERRRAPAGSEACPVETIHCAPEHIGEVIGGVRALLAQRRLTCGRVAGVALAKVQALAAALAGAAYGVIVWAPGQLPRDSAELTVDGICRLVADLNRTTRCAGLALGGDDGALTALGACAWITGQALRVSYAGKTLDYDPVRYQTARLLAERAVDAMVWISSFAPHPPPATRDIATIVLAPADLPALCTADVGIPVATPGIDSEGTLIRTDSVVSLRLEALRSGRSAPRVAEVLEAIADAL